MVNRSSLLPDFERLLNTFLMEEKGKVLILSVSNTLLRVLSQAVLGLELEMKSLTTPMEELKGKIEAFENKKKEVMHEKQDFDILLDGDVNRLVKDELDEDLREFKKELIANLTPMLESLYEGSKNLSGRELNYKFEEYVVNEIKNAYNNWRAKKDGKLASSFEAICSRFIVKINETVDSLLKFSSELFSIPFEVFKSDELWTVKSSFYYKFKDEPVSLELLATSFTLALPRFIGGAIILKKIREYMHEMIDQQGCRIRFDFAERLEKSKLDFRWEMLQRIEATIEGISTAIKKGMSQGAKGEKEVEERRQLLLETTKKLSELKDKLMEIKKQIC